LSKALVVRIFMNNSDRTKEITMSFYPVLSEETAVSFICCVASRAMNVRFKRHFQINNFRKFLHTANQNRGGCKYSFDEKFYISLYHFYLKRLTLASKCSQQQ
jgi:hypothetical protein